MKILVYPYYDNPYQDVLYKKLDENHNVKTLYFDKVFLNKHRFIGPFFYPLRLLMYRFEGYNIFHLHWQNFVFFTNKNIIGRSLSFIYSLSFIVILKILGFKLIWTIHNIIPHEKNTFNDLLFSKLLSYIADVTIPHSLNTVNVLKENHFNTHNAKIVPLGNFIGHYENEVSQYSAREALRISQNEFVILYFGLVRKYKGVEDLLNSFSKFKPNDRVHLVIAGKVIDKDLIIKLEKARDALRKKISLHLHHIPENEVQIFMNAADIVVLPFKKITTSSSVILALSFGKPVIYPNLGPLTEIPDEVGYKYNPLVEGALTATLQLAYKEEQFLKRMGVKGYQYVKQFDWKLIASKTYQLYLEVTQ